MERESILLEHPSDGVARVVLNRPDRRNAQDTRFLYELNDALDEAAFDRDVRVIVLSARGPHFSAGHDIRETGHLETQDEFRPVGTQAGYRAPGAEGRMAREEELYMGFCERWRNIPKPTIAAVQGRCISGGLMLAWPMDLIVASDDAVFVDVTVAMGIAGVEYFAHPWEVGVRKAKEMLFTGDPLTAQEAHTLGMVNRVVPRDELEAQTLAMAKKIAAQPTFAVKSAKQAVNTAQDAQGRHAAFAAAFALHHLNHSHAMEVYGLPVDPTGIDPNVRKSYKAGAEPFRAPESASKTD